MKKRNFFAALIFSLSWLTVMPPTMAQTSNLEQEIKRLVLIVGEAERTINAEKFAALTTDDFSESQTNGAGTTTRTKSQILEELRDAPEGFKKVFSKVKVDAEMTVVSVKKSGDNAEFKFSLTEHSLLKITEEGKTDEFKKVERFETTGTAVRRNGNWLLSSRQKKLSVIPDKAQFDSEMVEQMQFGMAIVVLLVDSEKPIFIQAGDLMKEYKENSKAADEKYKGKLLAVTGIVSGMLKTPAYWWISIRGDGSFNLADDPKGVGCAFDESEKVDLDKIKTSQKIIIVGINDGMKPAKMMRDGEYVALRNCRIGDEAIAAEARQANEARIKSKAETDKAKAETDRAKRLAEPLPDASTGQVPSDAELQTLLQNTIQDFADAIEAEDFTKFRENAAPWYKMTSAERYKEFYGNKIILPALRWTVGRTAAFSRPPSIDEFKISEMDGKTSKTFVALNLHGNYEDSGKSVRFEIQYNAVGKEWKINVISLNTSFRN